ncbi:hypothetical protein GN244_ATG20936 [Phytophthora infestans]|uniref:Integrase zinc-binding domain-containing protein n=1 Tax=Phytophthora infestans TaxID=4787 RepID=A0A833W3P9_PHYIN|nr:hypothetical protein GN244_ATG20936 [Phytophthora infestans]
MDEILVIQREQDDRPAQVQWSDEQECFVLSGNLVWIPEVSMDLIHRICAVAHAGGSGHRGARTTMEAVANWC